MATLSGMVDSPHDPKSEKGSSVSQIIRKRLVCLRDATGGVEAAEGRAMRCRSAVALRIEMAGGQK
jgi:hypothetical protein